MPTHSIPMQAINPGFRGWPQGVSILPRGRHEGYPYGATALPHPSSTVIAMKIDAHRHSGAGRNPGVGRWTPAFAGVTVRKPYHFHPRMWPAGAWGITMKIGSTVIPAKAGIQGPATCGVATKSPTTPPLDSGLRRNDGEEGRNDGGEGRNDGEEGRNDGTGGPGWGVEGCRTP